MRKRQVNHLVRALRSSGFYPENCPDPGVVNENVLQALRKFLYKAAEGKDVRRVNNALRSIQPSVFGRIKAKNYVTAEMRIQVARYFGLVKAKKEKKLGDYLVLRDWEIHGPLPKDLHMSR